MMHCQKNIKLANSFSDSDVHSALDEDQSLVGGISYRVDWH